MVAKVKRPGSRGGQVYIDRSGRHVYGVPPTGEGAPATADPVAAPPKPVVPEEKLAVPHWGEFGEWSPDAALLYLRQALAAAPVLGRTNGRYRAAVMQGLREGLAASYAFRGLTPIEIEKAVGSLGRIARLRAWDDHGRRANGEEPTKLPAPSAMNASPFVRGAVRAGVPTHAALHWHAISTASTATSQEADNTEDADLAARLLGREEETEEQPVRKSRLLLKAVMRPGSRGGHVYWMNGRLHYGTPPMFHVRAKKGRTPVIQPGWAAVGPVARRIIEKGRRILFRAADGSRQWGQIISAASEMLSVLPDAARPYDLLHTVCVPVEQVVRIVPDKDLEKSDAREDTRAIGGHAVAAGQADEPAADWSPWPEAEAEG